MVRYGMKKSQFLLLSVSVESSALWCLFVMMGAKYFPWFFSKNQGRLRNFKISNNCGETSNAANRSRVIFLVWNFLWMMSVVAQTKSQKKYSGDKWKVHFQELQALLPLQFIVIVSWHEVDTRLKLSIQNVNRSDPITFIIIISGVYLFWKL